MPDFATYAIEQYNLSDLEINEDSYYYFSYADKETLNGVNLGGISKIIISNFTTHNYAAKNSIQFLKFLLNQKIKKELPAQMIMLKPELSIDKYINFKVHLPSLSNGKLKNLDHVNVHLEFSKHNHSVSFECHISNENKNIFATIDNCPYNEVIENISEYNISLKIYLISRCYVYPIKITNQLSKINKSSKYFSFEVIGFKNKNTTITLSDDNKNFLVSTHTNRITKYTNLNTNNYNSFSTSTCCSVNIIYHNKLLYTGEQNKYNLRYDINIKTHKIYYEKKIGTPKHILVTFPGMSLFNNVHHQISALSSFYEEFNNILILSFQDYMGTFGNYMYKDENGAFIKKYVIDIINKKMDFYDIEEENLIFYGNSKGATICIDYFEIFDKSYFFIDGPQINLRKKNVNDLIKSSYTREYLDYFDNESLIQNLNNPKIFYSYSNIDYDSNCSIVYKKLNINTIEVKDSDHGTLIMKAILSTKRNLNMIIDREYKIPILKTCFIKNNNKLMINALDYKLIEINYNYKKIFSNSILLEPLQGKLELDESFVVKGTRIFAYKINGELVELIDFC